MSDLISREAVKELMLKYGFTAPDMTVTEFVEDILPSVAKEFEYHYDHTDCIWYRPEARNRCPTTCAQYRDGWNDAMNYIFRDGKGYRPYRRDQKYGE